MKKSILMIGVIITILAVMLLLPACNGEQEPTPAPPATPTPAPTTTPAKPTPTTPPPTTAPAPTVAPAPPAEPVTIKISYSFPKGKGMGSAIEWFAEELPKRSDGRYIVETYPANTLVPPTAVLDMVKGGSVEMATTPHTSFKRDFPLSMVTCLPMLGFPLDKQATTEENTAVVEIFQDFLKHPAIADEHKDFEVTWAWYNTPSSIFTTGKEIHKPEDFAGFRLGGAGPSADLVAAYGGASLFMIPPTAYDTMDKGAADGGVMNAVMAVDWKLYEILEYYYMLDIGTGGFVALTNKEFINSLPAADQQLIKETMKEGAYNDIPQSVDDMVRCLATLNEMGENVVYPTEDELFEWKLATERVNVAAWRQDCLDAGVDSVTISNVYHFWLDLRQEYIDKYNLE